jgi:lysozyme
MALFGIVPFGEDQLRAMSGDRSRFYLEDEVVEEVQEPSPLSRLGGNVKEGLGMMFTGDATPVGGPDMSDRFPWGAINKGREVAGKGVGLLQRGLQAERDFYTQPRTQSGIGGMITQAEELAPLPEALQPLPPRHESRPASVAEAQARGEKTFWVDGQEKLAVTAEQLASFKDSNAYDPNSGQSALSQWSSAWQPSDVAPAATEAPVRDVREILIEEEGMELTPYSDQGNWVTGVGHTIGRDEEPRDVTEQQAMENLEGDISEAYSAVDRLAEKFDVGEIPSELRDELMMMAFQMGATGLSKFKKMWGAMKNQDWGEMVAQMADSRWAKSQTPERAARTISRVATLMGV